MADPITLEQLQNASLDAQDIADFVNASDTTVILPRLGGSYPSARKLQKDLASAINLMTQQVAAIPAPVAKEQRFVAGTDFTAGTSTTITTTVDYGTLENIALYFGGTFQANIDTVTSYASKVLTFSAPIPAYVNEIVIKGITATGILPYNFSPTSPLGIQQTVNDVMNSQVRLTDFLSADQRMNSYLRLGTIDMSVAFQNALNYIASIGGGNLFCRAGVYPLASRMIYTVPGTTGGITLSGDGADITELRWTGANGGFTVNMSSPGHSAHVKDLSITTTQLSGGNGVLFNQTMSLNTFMQSDITRVTFRGAENVGAGSLSYWTSCYLMNGVCGTNVIGVTCYGPANWGNVAVANGGVYQGNSAQVANNAAGNGYSIYHNIQGSTFNGLATGMIYGSYCQGLTISQVNTQNTVTGLYCPANATGTLAQLQINSSQFANTGNCISIQGKILNVMIYGNNLISANNNSAVLIQQPDGYNITGNQIIGSDTTNLFGVAIGPASDYPAGIITGNSFINLATGVFLMTGSSGNTVIGNAWYGVVNKVNNSGGAGNSIGVAAA